MTRGPALPDEPRALTARYAAIDEAAALVAVFCARHAVDRQVALKLTLVVEELITNTIEHGFGAESDSPIRVALSASDAGLALFYEDAAPPFDPLAHDAASPASVDAPLDDRPIGGLGIHLIGRIAASVRYAREAERNRLWISLPRAPDSSTV
jgi:serine/threonine-protein kinase RsbW